MMQKILLTKVIGLSWIAREGTPSSAAHGFKIKTNKKIHIQKEMTSELMSFHLSIRKIQGTYIFSFMQLPLSVVSLEAGYAMLAFWTALKHLVVQLPVQNWVLG